MTATYQVNRDRWKQFTLFEQMGNIGSEVGRTLSAGRRGDSEAVHNAMVRALDLFEATAQILALARSPRLKEVLRAKDQYLNTVLNQEFNTPNAYSLEQYFTNYALAARAGR